MIVIRKMSTGVTLKANSLTDGSLNNFFYVTNIIRAAFPYKTKTKLKLPQIQQTYIGGGM